MKDLIEVFKMTEIDSNTRCKIIIELGNCINFKYGANLTEPLIYELVKQLNSEHPILSNDRYTRHLNDG